MEEGVTSPTDRIQSRGGLPVIGQIYVKRRVYEVVRTRSYVKMGPGFGEFPKRLLGEQLCGEVGVKRIVLCVYLLL